MFSSPQLNMLLYLVGYASHYGQSVFETLQGLTPLLGFSLLELYTNLYQLLMQFISVSETRGDFCIFWEILFSSQLHHSKIIAL